MSRRRFRVPREGERQIIAAQDYVARAWPEATESQIRSLFQAGSIKADGILVVDRERPLAPETLVDVEIDDRGQETFGFPDVEVLLRGTDWLIVDKPVGVPGHLTEGDPMDPVKFMADSLGLDRQSVAPVWDMPAAAGGPWLIATSQGVADRLDAELRAGTLQTTWTAIIERPQRPQGRWKTGRGSLEYALTQSEDSLAETQLTPAWKGSDGSDDEPLFWQLLSMCGEAGFPVLGDAHHGGYLVGGGIRLRLAAMYGTDEFAHSWPTPDDWWPDVPVVPAPAPELESETEIKVGEEPDKYRDVGTLSVSQKTVDRIEQKGHLWVLRDRETGSVASFSPGDPVALVGPGGETGIFALIDGTGSIVARVWGRDRQQASRLGEETEIRLDEAIGRRRAQFRDMGATDTFRIVDGEADGFPGLSIDRLGPSWRVSTTGHCARQIRQWIYGLLQNRDPSAMIVEMESIRGLRGPGGRPSTLRVIHQGASLTATDHVIARELGLRYHVDPFDDADVGLRAEQRDNRRRAVDRAQPGQHWLDLFAHSGAFAMVLGSQNVETTAVADSQATVDRIHRNLSLNAKPAHSVEIVDTGADAYLDACLDGDQPRFDGIIVDPPAHRRFDDEKFGLLIKRCLRVLSAGGSMLVCQRDRRSAQTLNEIINSAAAEVGRELVEIEDGPPAAGYTTVLEFPQGAPFEGLWVR